MPLAKKTRKKRGLCAPFKKSDFNSNDGMLTTVWGPSQWHFLHTMSFNYPVNPTEADKKHYRNYIYGLRHVLPCGKCRANLCKNLEKLPLTDKDLASRETFSKYVFNLHELINKMLGKKSGLTFKQVRNTYENFRSRCIVEPKTVKHKEVGCVKPLYGKKAKCVIKIVPQEQKVDTFSVDQKCIKTLI
jgi:hypothetical protein